ncbi:MAG: hypothetical protein WBA25_08720, partial [Jannaschia sp.]
MSRSGTIATIAAFTLAAAGAAGAAMIATRYVERSSDRDVSRELAAADLGWVDVRTDGLRLILAGFAPDERARFRAVTVAGRMVDPGRIIDGMDVIPSRDVIAPRFSLEILRNDAAVSLIGLMPVAAVEGGLSDLTDGAGLTVTDMVERVEYDAPEGWEPALRFAVAALDRLPRAKVSVRPGRVSVT